MSHKRTFVGLLTSLVAGASLVWASPSLNRYAAAALDSTVEAATALPIPAHVGPDYATKLEHHIVWDHFPVKVFFARDANYSTDRERRSLDGFDMWHDATDGAVDYVEVGSQASAEVVVHFNPASNDGYTRTWFVDGHITSADMSLGVKGGGPGDLEAVAAHEFGHAIGIDGHSDDRRDIMYPIHWMGTRGRITPRDMNTLATLYGDVAQVVLTRTPHRQGRTSAAATAAPVDGAR